MLTPVCVCVCVSVCVCATGSYSHFTHEVSKGVYLSLQPLPQGGYDLKRVRFAKQVSGTIITTGFGLPVVPRAQIPNPHCKL